MSDLFPDASRRPRRVLMKVYDAGCGCADDGGPYQVHLRCERCGHDAGWLYCDTKKEALTQPCPECNEATP